MLKRLTPFMAFTCRTDHNKSCATCSCWVGQASNRVSSNQFRKQIEGLEEFQKTNGTPPNEKEHAMPRARAVVHTTRPMSELALTSETGPLQCRVCRRTMHRHRTDRPRWNPAPSLQPPPIADRALQLVKAGNGDSHLGVAQTCCIIATGVNLVAYSHNCAAERYRFPD